MVGGEAALEIRVLHRRGKGIREIARETGSSRNTVRRYLRDESAARYRPRPPRATKLDPYKDYVVELLTSAAPERIPASVLLRELRERGYTGRHTMLKALVALLKPKEAAAPIVRFETEPGEQMQVDRAVNGNLTQFADDYHGWLQWKDGYFVDSGPSRGDPFRPAVRPAPLCQLLHQRPDAVPLGRWDVDAEVSDAVEEYFARPVAWDNGEAILEPDKRLQSRCRQALVAST
jgi:transcriptional regulator with XRE-family HTH domain